MSHLHPNSFNTDAVFLSSLSTNAIVGPDAWSRLSPQPVFISVSISTHLQAAATTDALSNTIDYSSLAKAITGMIQTQNAGFTSLSHLSLLLLHNLGSLSGYKPMTATVVLPKGILNAEGLEHRAILRNEGDRDLSNVQRTVTIRNLRGACIIGVRDRERLQKQQVAVTVTLRGVVGEVWTRFPDVGKAILEIVEQSSYELVESLALAIADRIYSNYDVQSAEVTVAKPSAIANVAESGVTIVRSKNIGGGN